MPSRPTFHLDDHKLLSVLEAAARHAERFSPLNEFPDLKAMLVLVLFDEGYMDQGPSEKHSPARAFKLNEQGLLKLQKLRKFFGVR